MKFFKNYYSKYWFKEHQSIFNLILHKAFIYAAAYIYNIKHRKNLKVANNYEKHIKKSNATRKVFVFANGPSLGDIDLKKIANLKKSGYDLIAINSFISKSANIAKPDYVVFADKIHFGLKSTDNEQYAKDLQWCIDNGITIFAPAQYLDLIKSNNKIAFNAFVNTYSNNTNSIYNPLGFYPLTALYALSIAKFLGYKEIYIAGFDNSYFKSFEIDHNNNIKLNHPHYYDTKESNTTVERAWTPTSELFFDFYRHFNYIEKITDNKTKNIFNVSKITYINTIPRKTDLDIYK